MASTQLTLFSSPDDAQTPPAEGLAVHTGNAGLASSEISSDRYGSPPVTFVLDPSMESHRWRLYNGGRPAGPGHDIVETVGRDVRRAIAKHLKHTATESVATLLTCP